MAKQCLVNKNTKGDITTVMVPNPTNIESISSKIAQKYNVLLNKLGFLLNNNSTSAVKVYGDLDKIAKLSGMTMAVTRNKNYKIYTDLLTNTIYVNQDTVITQDDIDSMLSKIYEKYKTKDLSQISKKIIQTRDKLVFKESKEANFSKLNKSRAVEEVFNSFIEGADYVEVTSNLGENRIFYDNQDQYPDSDIKEMDGTIFKVKSTIIGSKMGASNFNKIGDVDISQKVKHSLTAYNGRTIQNILDYWTEVWSNDKVLTESASTRIEKMSSDVYIELSNETPYMGVSPYDNYSISKDSVNPVLQNVKYITRSIIDTDPQAVKEAVENAKDYEEWLVNVSPANVDRIIFKNSEDAEKYGKQLNDRWGIEVATNFKSDNVGNYQIEGLPELNIKYLYGIAYNLYDSDFNEYSLSNDLMDQNLFYITNDSGSIIKELNRDEYLKIKSDISEKVREYIDQRNDLKTVFPKKIAQDIMFQNENSNDNLEQTPQEILKGVTDILLEKGLVDSVKTMTPSELQQVLIDLGINENIARQVDVWHGSSHIFDKFSTSAMGTGEGVQAFGWGLYFTDLKGIAKDYATKLGTNRVEPELHIDGEVIRYLPIGNLLGVPFRDINDVYNNYEHYLNISVQSKKDSNLYSRINNSNYKKHVEDSIDYTRKIIKNIESIQLGTKEGIIEEIPGYNENKGRNLYNVSLHQGKDPSEYTWLEWDRNVSEDIKKKLMPEILKANSKLGIKVNSEDDVMKEDFNGEALYRIFTDNLGSDKQASLFLLENGIDGVKYPAESLSRGATSDTARGFNYVVFDENAITINEKIQFQNELDKAGLKIVPNGFYRPSTREIYLNSENPNILETTIHEFSHPFLQWMRDNKPAHYQAGLKLLETNSTEAQPYIDQVRRTQPSLKEGSQEFYEEVLAEIVSSNGINLINSVKNNSVKKWLSQFWDIIKKGLNIFEITPNDISKMTLREFADIINISLYNQNESIERLIDLNIIERIC